MKDIEKLLCENTSELLGDLIYEEKMRDPVKYSSPKKKRNSKLTPIKIAVLTSLEQEFVSIDEEYVTDFTILDALDIVRRFHRLKSRELAEECVAITVRNKKVRDEDL